MIELPKRSDKIYIEIEEFKSYELTNCMVYEMAIRNSDFIRHRKELKTLLENSTSFLKEFAIEKNLSNKEEILTYLRNNDNMDIYTKFRKKLLDEKKDLISNTYGIYFFGYNELDDAYNSYLKRKGKLTNLLTYKDPNNNNEIIQDFLDTDNSTDHLKHSINEPVDTMNYLSLAPSRPRIKFPRETKEVILTLNMNLSKKELISYLSKIKDDYDEDINIVKSPLEFLNIDLMESDIKISTKKLADMFFVYDYIKIRQQQIIEENKCIFFYFYFLLLFVNNK